MPHRIYSSKIYPSQSPNGSTIVIYGHEQGVRILWRGGKNFKLAQRPKEKPKVNGSSIQDAMMVESDEEGPAEPAARSTADFEAEEDESDPCAPYHNIIRYLDIDCGTCVRHIAIPHIPAYMQESAPGAFPSILLSNIVVAAACNDGSVKLITLPLQPPLPSFDETSHKALQVVNIAGINAHHEVPSSITITQSAIPDAPETRGESSRSRSRSRSRVGEERNTTTISRHSSRLWCFMLVSISPTAGGLLLTHQIPLISDKQFSTSAEDLRPIHRCYVPFGSPSSKVVFNPSAYPNDRHSTVLVSAADTGCVKLYQVSPKSPSNLSRGRRNSAATTDPASAGLRSSSESATSKGRFLITFYPTFIDSPISSSLQRRKRILDASWVASGRAIFALLEDGEWGVWDLEGAGPGSGSGTGNLLRGQTSMSGIQGGALTTFALSGWVTLISDAVRKTQDAEPRGSMDRKLAPMTPYTRKVKGERLFKGRQSSLGIETSRDQPIRGHVCVTERAPPSLSGVSNSEESLIVAHGSNVIFISSLQALWRAEASTKGTLDPFDAIRPLPFTGLGLAHERVMGVAKLPHCRPSTAKLHFGAGNNESPDIMIVADHRLIFLASPLTEPPFTEDTNRTRFSLRLDKAQEPGVEKEKVTDQALLGQGQLDLEGMDRILDNMGHANGTFNGQGGTFGKSVAFDLDDDADITMASPTPKTSDRYKRAPNRSIGRTERGPFL